MTNFHSDSLRLDQNLSIDEQDRNIILSTGINKRTARKLAKKVFAELIQEVSNVTDGNEMNIATQDNPAVLCLHGIMSHYCDITGISTNEPGGKYELWQELREMVPYNLNGRKQDVLDYLISDEKRIRVSENFIDQYWEQIRTSAEFVSEGSKELTNMPALTGHRRLCLVYADVISKYLSEMKGDKSRNLQDITSTEVLQITG